MDRDGETSSGPASDALERAGLRFMDLLHKDLEGELESVVAGRYRLGERLGHGAHGHVHRALDALTGETVAVKLLPPLIETDLVQLRSEIAALRLLRLPGVAHLFDEGVHHGRPFLVMELVDGAPFPGRLPEGATRWTWEALCEPTLLLLDTLARVHAAGLVHRDIKPRNVLVTPAGRPVLLDFGLTVGRALSDESAMDSRAMGTPAYAAPEQCRGEPVDARADLYALGVMLWEALAGRRPHAAPRVSGIIRERLGGVAEPVERYAAEVPKEVSELVGELLEVDRERRPRSAMDLSDRLCGRSPASTTLASLPLVGRDQPLASLLEAAAAGRPVLLVGPMGSGRTRLLQEAAARLEATGRRVAWCRPGSRPFESLDVLSEWLDQAEPDSLEAAQAVTARALHRALSAGVVLFADDLAELDDWTRRALDEGAAAGAVLASAHSTPPATDLAKWGQVVFLEALNDSDLRGLFAGSDRLLHVHDDAARELMERSAGVPASVVAELEAWVRTGLAERSGTRLAMTRSAIDRLRGGVPVLPIAPSASGPLRPLDDDIDELLGWIHLAWPNTERALLAAVSERAAWLLDAELDTLERAGAVRRLSDGRVRPLRPSRRLADASWVGEARQRAHGRLGAALPAGAAGRLFHLVAAGEHEAAARESLVVAAANGDDGRLGEAEVALAEGLRAARRLDGREARVREREILRAWLPVALSDVTAVACDRLLYEMSRSPWRDAELSLWERLVRSLVASYESDQERATSLVETLPPFADEGVERWRMAVRVHVMRHCSPADAERVIAEARAWAASTQEPEAASNVDMWEGLLRYRQGRFRDAAELHLRSARQTTRAAARLSALLNAAAALLEEPALVECEAVARQAAELAGRCRHPLFAGRAAWLERAAGYRRGAALVPDADLVGALETVGMLDQAALAALTEAAIAWRCAEHVLAQDLAGRAARHWTGAGRIQGMLISRALQAAAAHAATGAAPPADAPQLQAQALAAALPEIGLQALALLAHAGAAPVDARPLVERLRRDRAALDSSERLEVLSIAESLAALARD